ncbi:MAG: hypothetical protein MHMPM18_000593 [Marteilia pararefringens]
MFNNHAEFEDSESHTWLLISDPQVSTTNAAASKCKGGSAFNLLQSFLHSKYGLFPKDIKQQTKYCGRSDRGKFVVELLVGNLRSESKGSSVGEARNLAAQQLIVKMNPDIKYWHEFCELVNISYDRQPFSQGPKLPFDTELENIRSKLTKMQTDSGDYLDISKKLQ